MSFKEIRGQERQIDILKKAIRNGTVAHAYLFTGIHGIGKKTTACVAAKALNCERANGDACESCSSCKKITHRTHPDILWIEPEGDYIKIGQVREMQERIKYTLYEGRHKVVIIDNAEKMNLQSANCLLKTLEEPPPLTALFLLTAAPYLLPATIRSRCQKIMFQPLSSDVIVEFLSAERKETDDDLQLLASLSGGSLGRAIQWRDKRMLHERTTLLTLLTHFNRGYVREIFNLSELLEADKDSLLEKLDLLRLWIRDLIVAKQTGKTTYLNNHDLTSEALTSAHRFSFSTLFEKVEIVNEIQSALQSNTNTRLAMDTMCLKLHQ